MNIEVENRKTYICIKIYGQATLNASGWGKIEAARKTIVDTIKKARVYKLFFDCRDVSGKITTIDRFLLASFLVRENLKFVLTKSPSLKIAMVLNPALIDADRFGEKVARNRGLRGLLTDNMQEAYDYLGIKNPEKNNSTVKLSQSPQPLRPEA